MTTLQISSILLENLHTTFEAQGKKFLRDVAKVLDLPYSDVLKTVYNKSSNVSIQVINIDNSVKEDIKCSAIVKHIDIGYLCNKKVSSGSIFCKDHFIKQSRIDSKSTSKSTSIPTISQLILNSEDSSLYLNTKNNTVMNKDGLIKGYYKDGVYYSYSIN